MKDLTPLGRQLLKNKWAKATELVVIFIAALLFIKIMTPIAGDNALHKQGVIWFAYIIMMLLIYAGMRLRGEQLSHFGASFRFPGWKPTGRTVLISILVLIIAACGFALGSIVMANITGIPEGSADMSSYDYMKGNLPMFLLSLFGVYIVSSFGEEFIYRGFLITRFMELGDNTKFSGIIAVIISSVIFGLVHYDWGPMGIVQTGLMGLGLGISYLAFKKKLWVTILAHAYMDTALMVQMYLNTSV
ncbi:MAG: CPBP family intramembrane metalloprotease [Bacteroidetes bacterium]|nr:CPBP family intramembrane metalloprotease [Bacteroidota bacterium]